MLEIGTKAPNFELLNQNGKSINEKTSFYTFIRYREERIKSLC